MDYAKNGGMWKVYASRDYDEKHPRDSAYVEVNLPDYMPTLPQDNQYTNIPLSAGYFVNDNYPNVSGIIKSVHGMKLPIMHGTTCPVLFEKGTQFLLYTPTTHIEDGFLIYLKPSESR